MPEDHPSPWSTHQPTNAPGWASPASYASYPTAPYAAPPTPALPQAGYSPPPPVQVHLTTPAGPGRSLAVAGLVLAGLALLVALIALAAGIVSAFGGDPGGGYEPMRGTVAPKGSTVTGPALAKEITTQLVADGGEPEGISCPATAKVAQEVTTVCHGYDYGAASTFVVFFEDEKGAYTLLEI